MVTGTKPQRCEHCRAYNAHTRASTCKHTRPRLPTFDFVNVHRASVREVVEYIVGLDSLRALLLVAEHKVYPVVQVCGDIR